jgi:hypothetical protein
MHGRGIQGPSVEDPITPVIERHILARQFDATVVLFGNATPPVLDWLVDAWPLVPRGQRAECLRQLWTHGRTGLLDGERQQETLRLFRQTPALRETLPRRHTLTLYRGVAAKSEAEARLEMHRPARTESRRIAVSFAARSPRPHAVPYVVQVVVRRVEVLANFDDREESEFVVDPRRLDDAAMRVRKVTPEEARGVLSAHERESLSRLEAAVTRKQLKE